MKSIKELRSLIDFYPSEVGSSISYFSKQNIDFDVFLPTKGKNLQRPFVWTIEQQRELIWSVFIGRKIPHCAIINIVDHNNEWDFIYQVIDGKQRLTTLFKFYKNELSLLIDDKEYFLKDLPSDYQTAFKSFHFLYYIVNEPFDNPMTDEQKINWFKLINFAGTPQDVEHMKSLS
jgi:uncharacterized protein with ParB-like and HNH nuclease domain